MKYVSCNNKYVPLSDKSDFSSQVTAIMESQGFHVSYQQVYDRLNKLGYINKIGDPTKRAYEKGLIKNKL